jgi:hypothetical protein
VWWYAATLFINLALALGAVAGWPTYALLPSSLRLYRSHLITARSFRLVICPSGLSLLRKLFIIRPGPWPFQLPPKLDGKLLPPSLFISLVFAFPIGIVQAISNQQVGLNVYVYFLKLRYVRSELNR